MKIFFFSFDLFVLDDVEWMRYENRIRNSIIITRY